MIRLLQQETLKFLHVDLLALFPRNVKARFNAVHGDSEDGTAPFVHKGSLVETVNILPLVPLNSTTKKG